MKHSFKRASALVMAAAMIFVLALTGCGGSSGSNEPSDSTNSAQSGGSAAAAGGKDDDTLTWILTSDISSLDPSQAYDEVTNMCVNQITEGILNYGTDLSLVTNLAESWEIVDPTTYVYNMRSDIKFSDGKPMTMEDVLWSVERHRDPEVGSLLNWMFASVESVEQTGDWQMTVKLAYADATWQYTFATTAGHIIEKAAYEADGSIVGTGAYRLGNWASGSQIVLERNEYFSTASDPIYFNKIVYNIIPEDTTRVEALVSGQADFALNPPYDMLDQLHAAEGVEVNMFETFGEDFLSMNTGRAPFNDANVRKAVASAIDLNAIYEGLLQGTAAGSTGLPFGPALYGEEKSEWESYASTYNKYPADMEAAKAYLAASGYPDGFECELVVNESSIKNSIAAYIQSVLSELGIKVSINKMTDVETFAIQNGSVWDAANNTYDYDMAILTWYADYPDVAGSLVPLYLSSNAAPGGCNSSAYRNAQVDELLKKQLTLTDSAERSEIMRQALDIIGEDVPMVILSYPLQGALQSSELNDFGVNACYTWNIYARNMKRQ